MGTLKDVSLAEAGKWGTLNEYAFFDKVRYNPSLALVQPRKIRPFITERLLMGGKESNQTK